MTDEKLLREAIKKSGYKMQFIAEKTGISYQSLLNKITNVTDFKLCEITALCCLLNISKEERDVIFFGDEVDKTATQ